MSTAEISIILITAREDYSMVGLPDTHILEPCIKSLTAQTFKNFELIVVDGIYNYRPNMFNGQPFHADKLPFKVKHLPVDSKHDFWHSRLRPFSCASFNTGIINAEGEFIIKVDDCCQFDPEFVSKMWDAYILGYCPLAMHIRYMNGKPAYFTPEYAKSIPSTKHRQPTVASIDYLEKLYGKGGLIRDTRWKEVEASGGQMIGQKDWFYGYSGVPMEYLLKVNGMDELMDGDFSIMDVDLGQRITTATHEGLFLLDKKLFVIEHSHYQVSERAFIQNMPFIKCNYAVLKLNEKKKRWKANADKLLADDVKFIKEETLRHPCSWQPHQFIDDCEGPLFMLWQDNQPIFDLKKEREECLSK